MVFEHSGGEILTFRDTLTTQGLSLWSSNIVGGEILTFRDTLTTCFHNGDHQSVQNCAPKPTPHDPAPVPPSVTTELTLGWWPNSSSGQSLVPVSGRPIQTNSRDRECSRAHEIARLCSGRLRDAV